MNTIKRCPITYEKISSKVKYSKTGIKTLSPQIEAIEDLALSAKELRLEAVNRTNKISIQGVQPKLSARFVTYFNKKNIGKFDIINQYGNYILKPQHEYFSQLPENEDLSMRLAKTIDIEVPIHGLIYSKDMSLTYFIKRFDRLPKKVKLAVEDFAQLSNRTRDTKYDSSIERLIPIIEKFCTFPILEKHKLFKRIIFNYLIGNEDMHLKNFSLITRKGKTELAPAYDFVNSSIVLKAPKEELALPLNGKKRNLTRKDFVKYFAEKHLSLQANQTDQILELIHEKISLWHQIIDVSFLCDELKIKYHEILEKHCKVIFKT